MTMYSNKCNFPGCGLTYESLKDLILHIEQTHLENPSIYIDRATSFVPLSCIIRYYSEEEAASLPRPLPLDHHRSSHARTHVAGTAYLPPRSNITPLGGPPIPKSRRRERDTIASSSFFDDPNEESLAAQRFQQKHSITSTATSLGAILGNGNGGSSGNGHEGGVCCHYEGCTKRYKNVNGLRYHVKHAHMPPPPPLPKPPSTPMATLMTPLTTPTSGDNSGMASRRLVMSHEQPPQVAAGIGMTSLQMMGNRGLTIQQYSYTGGPETPVTNFPTPSTATSTTAFHFATPASTTASGSNTNHHNRPSSYQ